MGDLESVVPEPLPAGFPREENLLWVLCSRTSPNSVPLRHLRLCPHSKGTFVQAGALQYKQEGSMDNLQGSHLGWNTQESLKKKKKTKLLLSDAECHFRESDLRK